MKIVEYVIHNVLRLSDAKIDMEGRHLILVGGRNDQGKSSALNALLVALCGKRGCDYPEIPLKDGEKEGWVRVRLDGDEELMQPDGIIVERHFRRERNGAVSEKLRVLDVDGDEAADPQTLLNRLYESRGFDPLAFERLPKKDKKSLMQRVLDLDFSEQEEEYRKLELERRDVNRDGTQLKARLEAMPKHPNAPSKEVSVSELMDELRQREQANESNDEIRRRRIAMHEQRYRLKSTVQELQKKLADAKKQLKSVETEYEAEMSRPDPVDFDTREIKEQVVGAEELNIEFRQNLERCVAESQLALLRGQSKGLTEQMQAIRDGQQKALEQAEWPVDGLSFDDDGLLYSGLPFEQADKSVRLRVSILMGMAINPKLRLLVCQDGSDLDDEHIAELQRLMEEHDFQMLLEYVTRNPSDEEKCQVIIHEGSVRA